LDQWKMGIVEAKEMIKQKKIKPSEMIKSFLARQKETEFLNSFISTFEEESLEEAKNLEKIDEDINQYALAGVPISLKDDHCWKHGKTTVGVKALRNFYPSFLSASAELFDQEGAIVIGKNNMDPWSMNSTTKSSFWGVTLNPWDNSRIAGEGGAASVSAGAAPLALSSDTGGETRLSASYCGLLGLRPTSGRVSRYGIIGFSPSFLQTGLLGRRAEDLSLALEIISGFDIRDALTKVNSTETEEIIPPDEHLIAAVPWEITDQLDSASNNLFQRTVETFTDMGIKVEEVDMPHFNLGLLAYYVISSAEASSTLSRYDGIRFGEAYFTDSLEEWYQQTRSITFGEEARRRIVMGAFCLNEHNYEKYYEKALQVWSLIKEDFYSALKGRHFLLLPTSPTVAPKIKDNNHFIEDYKQNCFCAPVSLAGLPSLSVPSSFSNHLPWGIQLVGRPFSESFLLSLAYKAGKEV